MRKIIGWVLILLGGTPMFTIPSAIRTMTYVPGSTSNGALVGGWVAAFVFGVIVVIGILVLRSDRKRK